MNKHRQIIAWIKCMILVQLVYRITRKFPREELFGEVSQLRKAAISAAANIAEGYARFGAGELTHALSMSLGSLAEVDTHLEVARREKWITEAEFVELDEARAEASRTTFALQVKQRRKQKQQRAQVACALCALSALCALYAFA